MTLDMMQQTRSWVFESKPAVGIWPGCYKEFPELVDGKSRIADNSSHRKCIYGIVARDSGDGVPVRHDNVICSLAGDVKSSLLQGLDSAEMRNAR